MGLVDPFSPVPRRHLARRPLPPPRPYRLSAPPQRRRQKIGKYLTALSIPVAIVALSRLAQFLTVGELLIGVYALVALVRRIPSHFSFGLAALSMVIIVVQLIFLPDSTQAENMAVFAYSFLVVGTVCSALEIRQPTTYSRFR